MGVNGEAVVEFALGLLQAMSPATSGPYKHHKSENMVPRIAKGLKPKELKLIGEHIRFGSVPYVAFDRTLGGSAPRRNLVGGTSAVQFQGVSKHYPTGSRPFLVALSAAFVEQ
jgi:hypothetical protein